MFSIGEINTRTYSSQGCGGGIIVLYSVSGAWGGCSGDTYRMLSQGNLHMHNTMEEEEEVEEVVVVEEKGEEMTRKSYPS